jgi:hypothetical protein
MILRIQRVEVCGPHSLRLTLNDGTVKLRTCAKITCQIPDCLGKIV